MERNRDLFWKLLEPEHPQAEAFSRKLMGNREDGDDLYQDALVLALTGFSSLKERAAFRPWLYRIIVNCYKNRFRTPWYRRVIPLTDEINQSLSTADPSHGYAISRVLQKALSAISSEERALITLFELEGWTVAELGRLYRKPVGTIKARLSRARKKMKRALLQNSDNPKVKRTGANDERKQERQAGNNKFKSKFNSPSVLARPSDSQLVKPISIVSSSVAPNVSRTNQE